MAVEVGQPAPDFTLYDTDRKQRKLSEFKGKNVVLAFFPGAFSGPCTIEMCALRDQMDQFNSLNAQVIGISVDPPGSQKAWADQNNLKFTLLSDFSRQVVNQYDVAFQNLGGVEGYVSANRAVLVLDKNGVVQYKWVAPSPATQPELEEVREALAKLG
jgi:glutaredoxin-dependent peroxiredoxin